MPSRLAHVLIFAKQMQPMMTFYERSFDMFAEASADPSFVMLNGQGGASLALHALPPAIADDIVLTRPPTLRENTALKACFEVDDLEAHRQRIIANGGQAKEPWQWEGRRYCECADPEGNVLQIFATQ